MRSLLHNVKVSLRGEKKNSKCDSVNEGEIELCEKDHKYHRPVITLQCWRCHQLCSDPIPGRLFPRADDVFVQGYSLFRSRVLSEWERWNFNEILLEYLKRELKIRLEDEVKMINTHGSNPRIRVIHNEVLDLERNILRAKGLRTALCVRIVHTKFVDDAVLYVLRVEDEESGLQWNVRKRYNDFYSLHKELSGMSKYLTDIPFPRKRIVSSKLSLRVIEERIVALEQFMRQGVHRLTQYATSDAQASQSLRRVQEFLDVSMFINCLKPPPIDDQRYLELMIYRRLNDFSSLACQQCIRFVDSVDLDAVAQNNMSNGYLPMLELVAQALREVEQYTAQQYGQQMNQILKDRRPNMPVDKVPSFVAKCIRRQVEGAIYLPLRRAIFRIVYSFIADKAERLQKSMKVLKRAPPKTFFEKGNYDELLFVKSLPAAISVFKDLVNAYLPSDQGNMLMRAAGAVMQVISDIEDIKKSKKSLDSLSEKKEALPSEEAAKPHSSAPDVELKPHQDGHRLNNSVNASQTPPKLKKTVSVDDLQFSGDKPHGYSNDLLNKSVLADPASTIFSAEDHVLVAKRDFDKDGSSVMQAQGEQEGDVGVVEGLVEDASLGNDAFRELYSIVKTEHSRGSRRDEEFEKTMQDMAAVALQATASSHVEKTWSGGDRGSLGGSDCESDELEAPVKCEQNNEDDDDDKEGDLDDDECDDDDEAPREGIPSGRKPPPVASAPVTAIRGSSVLRLEADSDPLFRPSQNRVETYISPFKKEPSAKQKQQVSQHALADYGAGADVLPRRRLPNTWWRWARMTSCRCSPMFW